MRIIQSSWTCNKFDMLRSNFGWLSPEYHLMGWTLSCLQLKQFYPIVDLYCDNSSKKILIDILQLPYDNVICNLDKIHIILNYGLCQRYMLIHNKKAPFYM